MIRTQIQLTEAQAARLKAVAAARGVSIAEVVREAVDRHIAAPGTDAKRQRMIDHVGGYRSGRSDVSADHDSELAEAFAN